MHRCLVYAGTRRQGPPGSQGLAVLYPAVLQTLGPAAVFSISSGLRAPMNQTGNLHLKFPEESSKPAEPKCRGSKTEIKLASQDSISAQTHYLQQLPLWHAVPCFRAVGGGRKHHWLPEGTRLAGELAI
ncbi:hypothetical protein Y1Q_0018700 [Alligator mississippiensis]|uniref:Uncharacterized protein n=1 Tax=Alligator mississippiensis TaxID=8496 RepID=A0A151NS36_ALLMI|nr:hypothetical protein Y1Q_0018700 [Alligator mississippiensis]